MARRSVIGLLLVLSILLSACSLFQAPPATPTGWSDTQIALGIEQTMAAMEAGAPEETPVEPPAGPITVTVSVDTNCRLGPGTAYEIVGVLMVGQSAEVVGRSAYNDNWIIRLPSNPAVTCWLWGQYATLNGDANTLPVIVPPPTPTFTPTVPLVLILPVLTIENNSTTTIFYAYYSLSSSPSWGEDQLGSNTIGPGNNYSWSVAPGTYDVKIEDAAHTELKSWFSININTPIILSYP